MANIHSITNCPDCGSHSLKYDDQQEEITCNDCGLIYKPIIKGKIKEKSNVSFKF